MSLHDSMCLGGYYYLNTLLPDQMKMLPRHRSDVNHDTEHTLSSDTLKGIRPSASGKNLSDKSDCGSEQVLQSTIRLSELCDQQSNVEGNEMFPS